MLRVASVVATSSPQLQTARLMLREPDDEDAAALLAYAYTRLREPARAHAELAIARASAASVRPDTSCMA